MDLPANGRSTIESLKLQNLANLSALIQGLGQGLGRCLPELQSTYQLLKVDGAKMKHMLFQVSVAVVEGTPSTPQATAARRLHVRCQAGCGMLLWMALMFNAILRACEPQNHALAEDGACFVDELVALAEDASRYRPLGSSGMPLFLAIAWAVTDGGPRQAGWRRC